MILSVIVLLSLSIPMFLALVIKIKSEKKEDEIYSSVFQKYFINKD